MSALGFLVDLGERVVTFGCSEGFEMALPVIMGRWATRGVGVVGGGGRGALFGVVLLVADMVDGLLRNLGSAVVEDMGELLVVPVVVVEAVTVMTGTFISQTA